MPTPTDRPAEKRDIIVIGASAGGVPALLRLVRALPADLPAAVLVVQHRVPTLPALLGELMNNAAGLPARDAIDGETPLPAHIYLAPPDHHLLIEGGKLRLTRGPKENYSRPAIDPLFRTAAQGFGSRVVGVILSGTLFDGTAGLTAVQRAGGVTLVQDPKDAAYAGMPESAIAGGAADCVLPLEEIAPALINLVTGSARAESEGAAK